MTNQLRADLNEMVFEGREKNYGAYDLRKHYNRHVAIGVGTISLLVLLAAFGPLLAGSDAEASKPKIRPVATTVTTIKPPVEDKPIIPLPPRIPPPQIRTLAYQIPQPDPDVEETESIREIEVLNEAPAIGLADQDGAEEGYFTGEVLSDGTPEVIRDESMPDINQFIGDATEPAPINMDDIKKLVGYPAMAQQAGIHGQVVVRVLVDKRGYYSQHKVINQVHPLLAQAVEAHISKLRFTPAIQGGKPIAFWVNIPFRFSILD